MVKKLVYVIMVVNIAQVLSVADAAEPPLVEKVSVQSMASEVELKVLSPGGELESVLRNTPGVGLFKVDLEPGRFLGVGVQDDVGSAEVELLVPVHVSGSVNSEDVACYVAVMPPLLPEERNEDGSIGWRIGYFERTSDGVFAHVMFSHFPGEGRAGGRKLDSLDPTAVSVPISQSGQLTLIPFLEEQGRASSVVIAAGESKASLGNLVEWGADKNKLDEDSDYIRLD